MFFLIPQLCTVHHPKDFIRQLNKEFRFKDILAKSRNRKNSHLDAGPLYFSCLFSI